MKDTFSRLTIINFKVAPNMANRTLQIIIKFLSIRRCQYPFIKFWNNIKAKAILPFRKCINLTFKTNLINLLLKMKVKNLKLVKCRSKQETGSNLKRTKLVINPTNNPKMKMRGSQLPLSIKLIQILMVLLKFLNKTQEIQSRVIQPTKVDPQAYPLQEP